MNHKKQIHSQKMHRTLD